MKPMNEYKRYKITVKEVGHESPITTEYNGVISREEVIEFFGLRAPDVESYEIEELPWEEQE